MVTIPIDIIQLAAQALSNHNDGWNKKEFKNQLADIGRNTKDSKVKKYIQRILGQK